VAASYELQVGTSPTGKNIFSGNVGNVLTQTVTGANGQTLYARVRAVDKGGNTGVWSNSSDGITVDTAAPRLASVAVSSSTTLVVEFNEPVRNAEQAGRYGCSGCVGIVSASRLDDRRYLLHVSNLQLATTYTLWVETTITDSAGNPMDPAYCSRTFSGLMADLVITSGSVQPSTGRAGQMVDVPLVIVNVGTVGCVASWAHIYLSKDSVYDPGDYLWIQGNLVPALGAGQKVSGILRGARIPNLPSSIYHVIAFCDVINQVDEWNEENNWKEIGILTIPTAANRWFFYR
jgi:hypothetical protein